ncbi:beta strand repeat-containing protein [Deinococcus altitudinis]|uniref:beta strand repeat-containing protein n=1 Tax=Deinococcus altitudinis TaxID=468914 RepID=UPI003891C012
MNQLTPPTVQPSPALPARPGRFQHRKDFRLALSLLTVPLLILSACNQQPSSAPVAQTPASQMPGTPTSGVTGPGTGGPETSGAPATQTSELRSLGLMRVTFNRIGESDASAVAEPLASSGISTQALSDAAGGIQLQPVASGSFVLGTRGAGGTRYLYATFKVRNASAAGTAYASARTNLTLLAVGTPATVNSTALSSVMKFDGSPASPAIAPLILPTHGMTFNRSTDGASVLSGAEDLQVFSEGEAAALGLASGVTRVFPYGFVVRNPATPSARTLSANPAAAQFDGEVTVAMKLPLQASATDDPFSFSLNVEAVDDSVTRVTESPEEQGAVSGVTTRAAALGGSTQVATLCGTIYSGNNGVFVGSATTAGGAGTDRLAHIGGNLALGTLNLPTYPVFGNTAAVIPPATGLLSNYVAYPATPAGPPPTLVAVAGTRSTAGSTLNVNPDGGFSFTPKVGEGSGNTDTIGYTVSDAANCTSPQLSTSVPITGRVWYAQNTAAPGGDGRSGSPFQTLAAAAGASSAGDTLYLFRGNGATTNQAGGITLKTNQRLIGSGVPLTLGGATLLPPDAAGTPTLGNSGGNAVTLATGNEISGLTISTSGTGIKGSGFGILTTSAVSVASTGGPALDLSTGVLAATFSKLSSSNSTGNGVSLVDTSGALTVSGDGSTASSGGVISNAAASGVSVTGTTAMPNLSLNWMNISASKLFGVAYQVPAGSAATTSLTLSNSALSDNTANHVQVNLGGAGNATYTLSNNTLSNPTTGLTGGIEVVSNHTGTATNQGRIVGNTVTLKSDASGAGNGISVYVNGAGVSAVQLSGNTVRNFGTYGIDLAAQQGSGTLAATISGNAINTPAAQGLEGMRLNSGNATAGESATLCLNLNANTSAGNNASGQGGGYVVRQRAGNTYQLQGYVGGATDAAAVKSFIQSREQGGNTARIRAVTSVTNATCATPTF